MYGVHESRGIASSKFFPEDCPPRRSCGSFSAKCLISVAIGTSRCSNCSHSTAAVYAIMPNKEGVYGPAASLRRDKRSDLEVDDLSDSTSEYQS
jgi:hypothetical protein